MASPAAFDAVQIPIHPVGVHLELRDRFSVMVQDVLIGTINCNVDRGELVNIAKG